MTRLRDYPRWDYHDLATRLEKNAGAKPHESASSLQKEAAAAIRSMIETNKEFHRRVQIMESPHAAPLERAKAEVQHNRAWAISSFNRMGHAFDEIKRIYDHIRRARPDGCDGYGYHSVSDMRFDGNGGAGEVWANRFVSSRGGIVSVRPAEVIGPLIDELLALRETAVSNGERTNDDPAKDSA